MLTLIAARDRNGAIGKDNGIPWHIPEDLAFFQRETTGGAVIMGRRTWHSLPFRPLKNRLNLVISSDPSVAENVFDDARAAADHAFQSGYGRIYGIGGAGIYAELLPIADRLLISEVDLSVADADTFFPEFAQTDWVQTGLASLRDADPACMLVEYLRRR